MSGRRAKKREIERIGAKEREEGSKRGKMGRRKRGGKWKRKKMEER